MGDFFDNVLTCLGLSIAGALLVCSLTYLAYLIVY
jgi:hypothetical protein